MHVHAEKQMQFGGIAAVRALEPKSPPEAAACGSEKRGKNSNRKFSIAKPNRQPALKRAKRTARILKFTKKGHLQKKNSVPDNDGPPNRIVPRWTLTGPVRPGNYSGRTDQ